MSNGDLLSAAEEGGFDVFVMTDQRIRYQQNLAGRKIALVVLTGTTKWSRVQMHSEQIADAVAAATPGTYAEVFIPFERGPATGV